MAWCRMFQIALALESARNGKSKPPSSPNKPLLFPDMRPAQSQDILLIDEVENGIHYSVLPDLWRFVLKAVKSPQHASLCHYTFVGLR